jgi:hypothetical protein
MELDENMRMLFEFHDLDPAVGNVDITYLHSGDNAGYYDLFAGNVSLGQSQESTTCGEYISSPANTSIPFDTFNNEYVESGVLRVAMHFYDPASANDCARRQKTFVNLKYQLVDCSYPSSMPSSTPSGAPSSVPSAMPSSKPSSMSFQSSKPSAEPSSMPSLSRFTALDNAIGSYYPAGSYDFDEGTSQYAALELLANSDPVLVPVPDDSLNSAYLLRQRYVLLLLYLYTNGDMWSDAWLKDEAGSETCEWVGVDCSDGGSVDELERTYSTVKTEPVI